VSVTFCSQALTTEAYRGLVIGDSKSGANTACCSIRAVQ